MKFLLLASEAAAHLLIAHSAQMALLRFRAVSSQCTLASTGNNYMHCLELVCSQSQQSISFSLCLLKVFCFVLFFPLVRGSGLTGLEVEVLNLEAKQGQNGYNMCFSSILELVVFKSLLNGVMQSMGKFFLYFLGLSKCRRLANRKLLVFAGDTEVWFQPSCYQLSLQSQTSIIALPFFN